MDYPRHRAECRRRIANSNNDYAATTTSSSGPLVECRTIDGRGRSLFATAQISIGSHPLSTEKSTRGNSSLCEAIAHPVLLESSRGLRCSYCFGSILRDDYEDVDVDRLLHRYCSSGCKNLDHNRIDEERAMRRLPSAPSPTALYCSRILRKFHTSPTSHDAFNELCHDANAPLEEEGEAYMAILTQCHLFLLAMADKHGAKLAHDMMHPDATIACRFMSRMTMNGFTISDSEQMPIGHGVYCDASGINHSCMPNCVPTFWIRPSTPPMLSVTACRDVNAGEEITIGYCDLFAPRHIRHETLLENYKFLCDCSLCGDHGDDRDDDVVGLRCTSRGCDGHARCVHASSGDERNGTRGYYVCDSCGNVDFSAALDGLAESTEGMKRLERAMHDGRGIDDRVGMETRRIYDRLKGYCRLQTSYYVHSSADLCVCWCANALKFLNSEEEQLSMCHMALALISESRGATRFCLDYPGSISWHVKRGTEAKLRLFANPMDMEALEMLRSVRMAMLLYYPSSDDLIMSLDESLRTYSFS